MFFVGDGESALQQLALDETCALFHQLLRDKQRLAIGGVESFHPDFGLDELFAEPDFHVAHGAREIILFGSLEEMHEERPECGLLHVQEERLQVRVDLVAAGERDDVGIAFFRFGEELLEVVLEVDDGIVQHEQPVEIAHGFLCAVGGRVIYLEFQVTVPHAKIETVVPREEQFDVVVGDKLVGVFGKFAVVCQEHYVEVCCREVPERKLHVAGKVFSGLVACV